MTKEITGNEINNIHEMFDDKREEPEQGDILLENKPRILFMSDNFVKKT